MTPDYTTGYLAGQRAAFERAAKMAEGAYIDTEIRGEMVTAPYSPHLIAKKIRALEPEAPRQAE